MNVFSIMNQNDLGKLKTNFCKLEEEIGNAIQVTILICPYV